MQDFSKILIIQTAFIGDVILATPLIEKLHHFFPDAEIDFLLRKGNEALLKDHPKLNELIIWNKQNGKYAGLLRLKNQLKSTPYDLVINLQRFASTGWLTWCLNGKLKLGFKNNPFSFSYDKALHHDKSSSLHEIDRNLKLIESFTNNERVFPKLYPGSGDFEKIKAYQQEEYICIAPGSVWFTKTWPKEKWNDFLKLIQPHQFVYLIGSPNEKQLCDEFIQNNPTKKITNLCGKISLLQSAALMQKAKMNYVNDSAPLHLASAMNAPVRAIFCSTVLAFGFGPLSTDSKVIETKKLLECRPCGIHGKRACPKGHFDCAISIDPKNLLS